MLEKTLKNYKRDLALRGYSQREVFTVEEVFRIIRSADNIKYKTILMLIYSSGLRVGELVNLKISDISRNSMRLKVRDGKGNKTPGIHCYQKFV